MQKFKYKCNFSNVIIKQILFFYLFFTEYVLNSILLKVVTKAYFLSKCVGFSCTQDFKHCFVLNFE